MPGSADEAGPAEAEYRPLLFSIAYGMIGSVGDAEDRVQHAFLGLTRARQAGTEIADPKAYLATAVTRLGISHLHSVRMRPETYVGDWLPEPIVVPAAGPGPAEHAGLAYSLSMAFLVLPETLSPVERAVFMLREAFGCGYPDLARITGKTEVNGRQIFAPPGSASPPEGRRATARRSRHGGPTARNSPARSSRPPTAATWTRCSHTRPDVVVHADGGGKAHAIGAPLYGRERAMRYLIDVLRRAGVWAPPSGWPRSTACRAP